MAGSFNFGEWISARSVIGDTLHEIGATNEKLFVCTPDVGMNLKQFRQSYPERYIDVGIAEQNCVGVAAGLALAGNIPVIMGMLPFLSMRACEQVRTAVCYQNLPVRIIGTGGGLTSGGGSTHNAMEDIAIVKSMVNMTVISICDPNMIRDILHLSMDYPGPMYIRLAQGKKDRQLYEPGTIKFSIGGSVTARGALSRDRWQPVQVVYADGSAVPLYPNGGTLDGDTLEQWLGFTFAAPADLTDAVAVEFADGTRVELP